MNKDLYIQHHTGVSDCGPVGLARVLWCLVCISRHRRCAVLTVTSVACPSVTHTSRFIADRHSLQFIINKIVYKIFGAMSKDLYIEIGAHFGIDSVQHLVANRRNRFINRYGETE